MRISKENGIFIAGCSVMMAGTVGAIAGILQRSSQDIVPNIQSRHDTLATSIGRPLDRDLDAARRVALPSDRVFDSKDFGNNNDCSPVRRSRIQVVDAACGLLEIARQREPEWSVLLQEDQELLRLNNVQENADRNLLISIYGGIATLLAGTAIGAKAKNLAAWSVPNNSLRTVKQK